MVLTSKKFTAQSEFIWMNWNFIKWEDAKVSVMSHWLHYWTSIFEWMRVYKTKFWPGILFLDKHIERFFYSGKALGMKIPFSKNEIKKNIIEIVKKNKIEEWYIRPLCFYSTWKMWIDPDWLNVDVIISAWPLPIFPTSIIHLKISKYIRLHPQSTDIKAKIWWHYANWVVANVQFFWTIFSPLHLDFEENIAEGSGENIFFIKDKTLFSPKKEKIFPWITRDLIFKIAKDLWIKVFEKDINPKDLWDYQEAFFCGSGTEIQPIWTIDWKNIWNWKYWEITKLLKEEYLKIIRAEKKTEWIVKIVN
jgi:branched-chain amino acid aminotransferase